MLRRFAGHGARRFTPSLATASAAPLVATAMRMNGSTSDARAKVMDAIKKEIAKLPQTYHDTLIATRMEEYINSVNFGDNYLKAFTPEELTRHLLGYCSAVVAEQQGKAFDFVYETEDQAFYFCRADYNSSHNTERLVENFIKKNTDRHKTHALTLRSYYGATNATVLYSCEWTKWKGKEPAAGEPAEQELEFITTEKFFRLRTPVAIQRYKDILSQLTKSIVPVFTIHDAPEDGALVLTIGFQADRSSYLTALTALFNMIPGLVMTKKFVETFRNGSQVYTFLMKGTTRAAVEEQAMMIGMLPHRQDSPVTMLYNDKQLSPQETVYSQSLLTFAFYFTPPVSTDDFTSLASVFRNDNGNLRKLKNIRNALISEIMSETYIGQVLSWHLPFVRELYNDFVQGPTPQSCASFFQRLEHMKEVPRSERDILKTFVTFNQSVKKTNFFKVKKAAIAFRLDPQIFMERLDFPTMPHGVFMFVGGAFRGFHVRFADIARGGVRLIVSKTPQQYRHNRRTLFQENYALAHAQLLKNKDIPESGSKGTILVTTRRAPPLKVMFLQYVDAMLDVMLPGEEGVRDNLGQPEIIFLGPDENTAGDFPTEAAMHAKNRGFKQWKAFTTGKGQDLGGIPHDLYGMTTVGVRSHAEAIYKMLDLDQTKLTKFQTGGPDGDLGANEILMGKEIYIGITDLTAVAYDPKGLNRDELVRLAKNHLQLKHFNKKVLSPEGFFVTTEDRDVTLPDGTLVENGITFRDEFFLSDYVKTDVFIPCGGRPASVTLENVHRLLVDVPDATGDMMFENKLGSLAMKDKLRYKYIVEGANLFITQEARIALENVGVVIIKDSSANKGGVTSSSIEVLAALSLTDDEFEVNMKVKNGVYPKFYNELVREIVERIKLNCTREFDAMSAEVQRGSLEGKRSLISDSLSRKIVRTRGYIYRSNLFDDRSFVLHIMRKYVPKVLQELVPVEKMVERVPEAYLRAIFSIWLASDYMYKTGLEANEFLFFQYMHELYSEINKSG